MRRLRLRVQARADVARARVRRIRNRTRCLGQMPGHPERLVLHLPDPIDDATFWDMAEQLLDDGLAEVCERTGWTR